MPLWIFRSRAVLLAAALTVIILFAAWKSPYIPYVHTYNQYEPRTVEKTVGFHLLAPATSSNENLCRLLASIIVTRYPDPVMIGWGGQGEWKDSHLFKVSETAAYLNALPSDQDDDLVVLIDAFDIWLQLPPDVMIKRYLAATKRNDDRLARQGILHQPQYRTTHPTDAHTIKTTLLWGADKLCWPQENRRAACWSAPDIPDMPDPAMGPPRPDDNLAMMPRWLNSGTLIGPVKDMRDMFNATMEMIGFEFDSGYMFAHSDQQYFSDVWAEQEVGRMRTAKGMDAVYGPDADSEVPLYIPGRRTEYHVGIDHMSEVFQTNAFYSDFMTWMRFDRVHATGDYPLQHPLVLLPSSDPGRLDHLMLEEDVTGSTKPFAVGWHGNDELPFKARWEDVMLGTNTITGQPFPLYHITGDKSIRDRWWPRMWFHNPSLERLLKATIRERKHAALEEGIAMSEQEPETREGAAPRDMVVAVVEGVRYVARDTRGLQYLAKREGDKGGAWSDDGRYLSWDLLCSPYEDQIFVPPKEY